MPGKRAAAPRGATASGGVHLNCSDLPELLVAGLFDGIKKDPPRNAKEQKCNANLIATYRLLNREFRSLTDARILVEFSSFQDRAIDLFDATFKVSCHEMLFKERAQTAAEEAQLKVLKEKKDECAQELFVCGKNFFPEMYAKFYTAELSNRSPLAASLLLLLRSVSNFMSIARERCFAHCCSGLRHCTNTATAQMQEIHTSVWRDIDNKRAVNSLVYCKRECLKRACVNASPPSRNDGGESRIVKEMLRFKGLDEHSLERVNTAYELNRVRNPLLIMNISGMEKYESLQKQLELDINDVKSCRDEIRRKDAQTAEKRQAMLDVEIKFMLDDVDAVFKLRKDLFFDSLESAKVVFPRTVGAICSAIADTPVWSRAAAHGTDNRVVNLCLNHIAVLTGPVREADQKLYKDKVASREAYDFMSGHVNAKGVPTMFGAADFLNSSASGFVKFNVEQVCKALHIFDDYGGLTMGSNYAGLRLSQLSPCATIFLGEPSHPLYAKFAWTLGFWQAVDQMNIDTVLAERGHVQTAFKLVTDGFKKIDWFVDAFNKLNNDAQTRTLALAMISLFPRDICKQAAKAIDGAAM